MIVKSAYHMTNNLFQTTALKRLYGEGEGTIAQERSLALPVPYYFVLQCRIKKGYQREGTENKSKT